MSMAEDASTVEYDDQSGVTRYKFMTNILEQARHKTRYVKMLENITIDAQVSYERLVASLAAATISSVIIIFILTRLGPRFSYMALPLIILWLCILALIVLYMISSRKKPMISSVYDLIKSQVSEQARLSSTKNHELFDVGIKNVEDGVLNFSDGTFGRMYRIEGHISRSMLPAVADAASRMRHNYFITRAASTQETMITSIQRADLDSKKEYLKDKYEEAKASSDEDRDWRMHYSNLIYKTLIERMETEDSQMFQLLIIREESLEQLDKACQKLEDAAVAGLYAHLEPIKSDKAIARRLSEMTALSQDGLRQLTGGDTMGSDLESNPRSERDSSVATR